MGKTCIIAEHDPWDIRLLSMYVERLGFRLIRAFDGLDVLRLARSEQPDVIVLDGDLPGTLRSEAVVQALQADAATRTIPIVILSWFEDGQSDAPAEGGIGRLQKPASYDAFCAALAKAGVWMPMAES